jgi:predicted RNA-binding Zn-ribbon protein involved in translation (DUF1610 family)
MRTAAPCSEKADLSRVTRFVGKLKPCSVEQLISFLVLSAGTLLAITGILYILEVFSKAQNLDIADPILGLPFRMIILLFGLLELLVAGFCLFTTRRIVSIWLIHWLVAQFILYRICLWQIGWAHPIAFVSVVTDMLPVSAQTADILTGMATVSFLVGSIWSLVKLRQARLAKEFSKTACPACNVHIRFPVRDLGQNITCPKCGHIVSLRRLDELVKMFCYFCKGHIEFPAHAVGAKLKCPHCEGNITLKEFLDERTKN